VQIQSNLLNPIFLEFYFPPSAVPPFRVIRCLSWFISPFALNPWLTIFPFTFYAFTFLIPFQAMNAGKFSFFAKILFVTGSILASASMPANAELIVGISFPSQGGGDNDTFEIDESLLTLPKLHLQDGPAFGPDIRNWSSDPTIKFSTTYTMVRAYYPHQTFAFTNVFPAFSYSPGPANFGQGGSFTTGSTVRELLPSQLRSVNVGGKGTLHSSAASDSSISTSVLATAPQPASGILTVTLNQNTLQLD